jgi:hypothetical protein
MNGTRKFHKATGPAFLAGEKWYGISGKFAVTIVSLHKYPGATSDHTSDYGVVYEWMENGEVVQHEKDAWNFQVRYEHQADLDL